MYQKDVIKFSKFAKRFVTYFPLLWPTNVRKEIVPKIIATKAAHTKAQVKVS